MDLVLIAGATAAVVSALLEVAVLIYRYSKRKEDW